MPRTSTCRTLTTGVQRRSNFRTLIGYTLEDAYTRLIAPGLPLAPSASIRFYRNTDSFWWTYLYLTLRQALSLHRTWRNREAAARMSTPMSFAQSMRLAGESTASLVRGLQDRQTQG